VLVGWGLDNAVLKSVFPGAVTMKANTALAFVLAGMSLWLLGTDQASLRRRRIAVACAALVALIGSLTFAEYLFGWNLGIDQLLFQESSDAAGTSHPGRMAPTTALNFILIGAALALLDAARGIRAVQLLVVLAGFIGLLGVIGYLYRVKAFYGIASYTEMALHTAVAFVVLSVSILCARPDRGLMAIAASDTAGGIMTRRLLPFAIGVPFVLGFARLTAERAGFFSTEFGVALFAVSLVVLFAFLIMWIAGLLHHIDMERSRAEVRVRKHEQEQQIILEQRVEERTAELRLVIEKLNREIVERKRSEETLRESEERFRLIMEYANDAIFFLDLNGVVQWTSNQASLLTGRPMSELVGRPIVALLTPASAKVAEARLAAARRGEAVQPIVEMEVIHPTGDSVWLELNAISVTDPQKPSGRLIVARDITERKRVEEALRENEQQMRLFMLATNDSIWNWDMAACSVTRSGFERAFGYSAEEVVPSVDWWKERLHPDDRERVLSTFQDAVVRGSITYSYEYRFRRRDGSYAVISDRAYIVRDGTGNPVRMLGAMTDITERKRAEVALHESGQRLNQLLDDRERISRDLHDNIIQMLYAIGLGLEESQRLLGKDSRAASSNLSHAVKELNAVIRDVRSYIAWSEPKISDGRQMKAAIERLARTMEGTDLLHFRLKVDQAAADKLTPEEASHVLYIAQEAMSNSLRHSQARDGIVVLEARDGKVCLVVADVGEGFDTTDTGRYGQGLRNMAARAQKLDARLQIISEPGLGVRIMLDIPMVKKRAPAGV
jgi:PAS domain S-box-containing protein